MHRQQLVHSHRQENRSRPPSHLGQLFLSLSPSSLTVPTEPAAFLPCSPVTTTVLPSKPPPAWTRLPGWEDLWNRPSPAPYNLDDDFLPGDGSPSPTCPPGAISHRRRDTTPTTEMLTRTALPDIQFPGEAPSQDAGFCLGTTSHKKRRLVARCPDAM